jgi:hypothetical protein
VSIDVEMVIGVSDPEKNQVDQEKVAAILELLVATFERGVAGGNGRHGLDGSLR